MPDGSERGPVHPKKWGDPPSGRIAYVNGR